MSYMCTIGPFKRGCLHKIFLISPQKKKKKKKKICYGYSLEVLQHGASNEYLQHIFLWKNMKILFIFRRKKVPNMILW